MVEGRRRAKANLAAATVEITEPTSFEEALASPQASEWQAAMDEEVASLHSNHTWDLEELPRGAKTIPVQVGVQGQADPTGSIERFKARLVAKGYMQRAGVDFDEVYAPVSKHASLRTLLAITAAEDLELHSLDIKTAFLNGELEEEVYIDQPPGYEEGGRSKVAHLRRALYGLRQAPRTWHLRLKQELESMGFKASDADPGLFTCQHKSGRIALLVYVDDLLIAAPSLDGVSYVKQRIQAAFDTHDLGEAAAFLGMSIQRDRASRTIKLAQTSMVRELVEKYGLADAKPKGMPLSPTTQLSKSGRRAAGHSRIPLQHPGGQPAVPVGLHQAGHRPSRGSTGQVHGRARGGALGGSKGVLRYLRGTAELGVIW